MEKLPNIILGNNKNKAPLGYLGMQESWNSFQGFLKEQCFKSGALLIDGQPHLKIYEDPTNEDSAFPNVYYGANVLIKPSTQDNDLLDLLDDFDAMGFKKSSNEFLLAIRIQSDSVVSRVSQSYYSEVYPIELLSRYKIDISICEDLQDPHFSQIHYFGSRFASLQKRETIQFKYILNVEPGSPLSEESQTNHTIMLSSKEIFKKLEEWVVDLVKIHIGEMQRTSESANGLGRDWIR